MEGVGPHLPLRVSVVGGEDGSVPLDNIYVHSFFYSDNTFAWHNFTNMALGASTKMSLTRLSSGRCYEYCWPASSI